MTYVFIIIVIITAVTEINFAGKYNILSTEYIRITASSSLTVIKQEL